MAKSSADQVKRFVFERISRLFQGGEGSRYAADLAMLRRGIGKDPGSMPELWELTFNGMPENLRGKGDQPSFAERAVHTSLTLFALHQQGKDGTCMSESNVMLGDAVRQLIQRNSARESAIKRRFLVAVSAESFEELTWHVRGLVQLLRAEEIRLDYPQLAKELYQFQFPEARDRLRLQWGRQLYRPSKNNVSDQNNEKQEEKIDEKI